MGEWISLNEYSRRYHMHHDQVKRLIANGRIECEITKGGYYKIWDGGKDTVSKADYEEEKRKRIEAETTLELIRNMLMRKEVS